MIDGGSGIQWPLPFYYPVFTKKGWQDIVIHQLRGVRISIRAETGNIPGPFEPDAAHTAVGIVVSDFKHVARHSCCMGAS